MGWETPVNLCFTKDLGPNVRVPFVIIFTCLQMFTTDFLLPPSPHPKENTHLTFYVWFNIDILRWCLWRLALKTGQNVLHKETCNKLIHVLNHSYEYFVHS